MSYEGEIRARTHTELCEALFVVNRMLRDEAARREWCSDFDQFVDDVNAAAAPMIVLEPRRHTKRIRIVVDFDAHHEYAEPNLGEATQWIKEQAGCYSDSIANIEFDIEEIEP